MTRFRDVYAPEEMPGFPCVSSPRFSTLIASSDSGAEQVNRRWQHPLHKFTLPEAVREHSVFEELKDHWLVMGGPAHTWPFRDPMDFASVPLEKPNVVPVLSGEDVVIGTGDGINRSFQLVKPYTRGAFTYERTIVLPVVSTLLVMIDGVDPVSVSPANTWTVSRPGGVVEFLTAPDAGAVVSAGFLYDVIVRFENDEAWDGIVRSYQVSGFADITLIEQRYCD